jgi:hypothetical protein
MYTKVTNAHSKIKNEIPNSGRKFLGNYSFRFKKKLPNVGQLVLHDASMFTIISKLLFTKAVNASPFNKF